MGARLSYPEADQSGRVAVVTGGNTGIGYETAKGLALLGAHVVIACRNEEKATACIERMRAEVTEEHPDKSINVEFMGLDLSSLQSVKKFIEDYKQRGLPLHLLINNAGIAVVPQGMTDDGFESHFQVNHLGHFYLTLELLPLVLSSAPNARIVFVSSDAHRIAHSFDLENLQGEKQYDRLRQYGNSKLYNILAAAAIQRRIVGRGLTVSAVHPGTVETEISRNFTGYLPVQLIHAASKLFRVTRDPKAGAATTLYAAVHPDLDKEELVYYSDCKPAYMTPDARSTECQEQLWRVSCELLKDYLSADIVREYGLGADQPSLSTSGEEPQVLDPAQDKTSDKTPEEQTADKTSEEQMEDKVSEEQTEDKMPEEQMADKTSEEQIADKTPEEQKEDKTSEEQMADKTSEEQIADKTPEEQKEDKISEEQMADKTSEEQIEDKTSEEQKEDKTPEEQMADKTSEEQMADKMSDEQTADKMADEQTADKMADE